MPIKNNVILTKFNTQTRNYNTTLGALSLKANVGERLQVEAQVETYWFLEPIKFSIFENGGRIVLEDASNYIDSGFFQGDTIEIRFGFVADGNNQNATGTVINVSNDGKTIFTDINTLTNGLYDDTDPTATTLYQALFSGLTPLENMIYRYNFVDNEELSGQYDNIITGDTQEWQVKDILATATQGVSMGKKRWRHEQDFLQVTKLPNTQLPINRGVDFGSVGGVVPNGIQNFLVEHRVSVLPYYQNGQLNNLLSNETIEDLKGELSYKYIYQMTFKNNIKDANETKTVDFINDKGSVGWFNENFNGNNNQYSLESITYTDNVNGYDIDEISLNGLTDVQIIVNSADGTFTGTQNFTVMHSYLPQETILEDNYYNKNYIYENINRLGFGSYIGNVTSTLINPNQLQIDFQIDLSSTTLSNQDYYLLSVILDDDTLNAELSDRVNLLVDVKQYFKNTDIDGLLFDIEGSVATHYADSSYTESKGWVQDAVSVGFEYKHLPFSFTENINIQLVAWQDGTENYFVLQNYNIATSNDFNISNDGYEYLKNVFILDLDANDNLILSTGTKNGTYQNFNPDIYTDNLYYSLIYLSGNSVSYNEKGIKLETRYMWHEWLSQPDAPNIFIDNTQENNGLNKKVSNYSLKQGYTLRWILDTDIRKEVNGEDIITKYIHTIDCDVKNFGENADQNWELDSINTYTIQGDFDTECVFLTEEDMRIEVIFRNLDGSGFDINDYQGAIRLEAKNPTDEFQTLEIGTDEILENIFSSANQNISEYIQNTPLGYPLNGIGNTDIELSRCKIEKVNDTIVLTTQLKKVNGFLTQDLYTVSGRIGLKDQSGITPTLGEFTDDFNDDFFI